MKCDNKIAKALWDSKYGDIFKTNIPGAVLGAITDPDGDGKVSLNDILLGIGGAHVWRAYRAGNLSAGLSMKIVHDFDVLSHSLSRYSRSLTPEKVVEVFKTLKIDSELNNFVKFTPKEVKKILEDSLDTYTNPKLHLKLWGKYGMYIPADLSIPRLLDFHELPGLVDALEQKIKTFEMYTKDNKYFQLKREQLSNGIGGYASGNELDKSGTVVLNHGPIPRVFTDFVHEYQHLHQIPALNGSSPSYMNAIKEILPAELQKYSPESLYQGNVGEAEARYIVALKSAIQDKDNKFLQTHPMVHMLNNTSGKLNFINSRNLQLYKIEDLEDAFALPKVATLDYMSPKPNEIIEVLAIGNHLDNKHIEFIYQELDKPGSVKITKKNKEAFITDEKVRKFIEDRFKF